MPSNRVADCAPKTEFSAIYGPVRGLFQNLTLKAYPDPERKGCSVPCIAEYARKVPAWETVEGDAEYEHIMHCSLCYAEFLTARETLRAQSGEPDSGKRLPRKMVKQMNKALTAIEKILKEG